MSVRKTQSLDRYASRYMTVRGQVVAHQRLGPTWRYHGTFALVAAIVAAKAQMLMFGGLGLAFVAVAWLFFGALRVTVTSTHVHVQYGLLGPKIPIECIRSAEAIEYDWTRYRGGFIRHRFFSRETLYGMPGDRGRALRIRWSDRVGREKTTVVACPDPDALARSIEGVNRVRRDERAELTASDERTCLPPSGEN